MPEITNQPDTSRTVYCSCGCGKGMKMEFKFTAEDNVVIVDTITSGFQAYQYSIWDVLYCRVKAAWYMLRGKEYIIHEIVINRRHWTNFIKTINKLTDQNFIEKGDCYYDVT